MTLIWSIRLYYWAMYIFENMTAEFWEVAENTESLYTTGNY